MPTPSGKGRSLDAFNAQLRADEGYRAYLRSLGANPDGPLKLSGSQRAAAERWVRQRFQGLSDKFQIDPAGNVNTDHGLSTAWSNPYFRYPLLAAGAVGTAGALGAFSGAGAAGSAGGGAAGGVLPSSQIAMSPLYTGPVIAGGSQGVSAGIGAGLGAAGAGIGSAAGAGGADVARRVTEDATKGLGGQALDWIKDPKNLAGLAGLIPLLTMALKDGGGGGDNPYGDAGVNDEISKGLALQRQRVEQTQPVFDTLVNMSYGSTPTRYRGAAPTGYPETAQAAPDGPYKYSGPRF